ncbi:Thoeris anti-defense Tad2 family protein [Xenorhabdus bovienii]|uniref:DUF2829 domain-containing protein n=1 Tax=Xenorhabdus bovienii TaxID=40576 RepID=A0A0B6X9M6_XENBV|nr:MW1434 family type I TA system toxin [Xenorhabdus bovienii]CDM90592.1 conserved protein of unknown function [Xenorhabdus bovienii]
MSEVNKPENDNADLKCPFDPEQYKAKVTVSYKIDNDIAAPIGSLPWALIQVYTGKLVNRSVWNASNEYIQLTAKNDGSTPIHIEKHDQQSFPYAWEPTPEDLMACDWELVKSNCMLEFDLKIGTGTWGGSDQDWGYLADNELKPGNEVPFGTLTNFQNETDIIKFSYFVWYGGGGSQFISIRASSDNNQGGYQKIVELFKKELTVTVDGTPYHLGSSADSYLPGKKQYEFAGQYNNTEAQKLGALLKQNVGNTLHFCFNWK